LTFPEQIPFQHGRSVNSGGILTDESRQPLKMPRRWILSALGILRQSSRNGLRLGDCVQFFVKSTSLEEIDECELTNHQPENCQENSTASIVKANDAAKAVESEQFSLHHVVVCDCESSGAFDMKSGTVQPRLASVTLVLSPSSVPWWKNTLYFIATIFCLKFASFREPSRRRESKRLLLSEIRCFANLAVSGLPMEHWLQLPRRRCAIASAMSLTGASSSLDKTTITTC